MTKTKTFNSLIRSVSMAFILMLVGLSSFAQTFTVIGNGTAANGSSTYPAPFGQFYWGARHQFLVTAAELSAAGIASGSSISSLGFNVTATNGAAAHQGYNVKVYTTATANPIGTSWLTTGLVASSTAATVTPVVGWNQTTLTAPFIWGGTENLVVEVCFNNSAWTNNASTQWTTTLATTSTWSRWYRADASGVCANTGTTGTSTNTRPNIRFEWTPSTSCNGIPAPGNTVSSSSAVCPNAQFTLSLQNNVAAAGITYQWQSSPDGVIWTNISGANSSSYTATQTTATYYQCDVTCSGFGSALSTPIQVTMNSYISCYCTPTHSFGTSGGQYGGISNVEFGTLNVPSTNVPAAPYYSYNTTANPTIYTGVTTQLKVNAGGYGHYMAWIDYNQSGSFDPTEYTFLGTYTSGIAGIITTNINVPLTAFSGPTRMRIRGEAYFYTLPDGTTACSNYNYGETEDYLIDIQVPPACTVPAPGNTLSTEASVCAGTSFTLSMQNPTPGIVVTYQWESSTDNITYTPISGATFATAVVSGQTVPTYYRCQVTCDQGPVTTASTEVLVAQNPATSCYCTPVYTTGKTAGDLISNVVITGTTLANNSGTSPVNPAYTYFPSSLGSNYTANLVAGNTYNVQVTIGSFTNQGVAVWVDFNDDGVFTTGGVNNERVGYSNGTISPGFGTGSFPITLACNPPQGTHRMRVRLSYATNGINIDPCATYTWGETEDYDVIIDPPLPCPAPSSFASNTPSATGATFTWVNGCAESQWQLEYGPTGFTPGSGTTETVTTPSPYASTTLPCGTTLDVYLRADCIADGFSTYVGPISVTSLPCPCSGTPPASNTVSSVSSACAATPFNLSLDYNYSGLTGITYQWQSDTDPLFGAPVNLGTGATETVPNQTVATYYRCQITCTTGPITIESTPVLVGQNAPNQCYCNPGYTVGKTDGDLISNVVVVGTTLANNTGISPVNPAYTYFNGGGSQTGTMIAGNTYQVEVTIGSFPSQGVAVWIDFNDDGVFSTPSERVGFSAGTIPTAFGTGIFPITLPCNPVPGVHRMRVRLAYFTNGNVIDPCTTYSFGETEDYDITVDPPLPCPAPSAFASNTPTATGANFTWVNGCTETDWEVEYGVTGFTPGSGTVESATTNPFTTTGMSCGTTYDVYLRANCIGNGYSTYVGPISVTTTQCPCTGSPAQANVVGPIDVCPGGSVTLSLDVNYTGLSGITYQWESDTDPAFSAPVALGTAATQVATQTVATYYRCNVTCTASSLSTMANSAFVDISAAPLGQSISNPIVIGNVPVGTPYTNTVTNSTANCFVDNLTSATNQASQDVWYQFTLACPSDIDISLCGSGFDTYLHLLDGSGNELAANDDNGPLCSGTESSIQQVALAAGTYYIVTEGFGSNVGALALSVVSTTNCDATLALTCYMQGYYTGAGTMAPVLSNQGLPNPTTDCDDVVVELHDATSPYALVETFSGVISTNGVVNCTFPGTVIGNSYYIVVLQRNHVQTWSANPVTFASTNAYNFSTAANQAYGDNQVEVETGVFAFYAGDVNQDLAIDGFDYIDMDPNIIAGDCGYFATDLNGDGCVDAFDFLLASPNIDAGVTIQAP